MVDYASYQTPLSSCCHMYTTIKQGYQVKFAVNSWFLKSVNKVMVVNRRTDDNHPWILKAYYEQFGLCRGRVVGLCQGEHIVVGFNRTEVYHRQGTLLHVSPFRAA